jgi:hypothetical protein
MYIPLLYLIGCGQTEVKQDNVSQVVENTESVTDEKNSKTQENKTEENKTEENKTEENKTEETKTEETKTEETKTEEIKTEEIKTEETKTEETKTDIKSLLTLERLGSVPALKISDINPVEGSSCYFSVDMMHSKIYSTFRMKRMGATLASPLQISYNEKALKHVSPTDIQKGQSENSCNGTYAFPAKKITISAPEEKIDTSKLSIGLISKFPLEQFDSDFWWIYTKNQVRVILKESQELYEKEVKIDVQLRKMGGSKVDPHLVINKEEHKFSFNEEQNIFEFQKSFAISSSAFVIYAVVPSGCSDMLLEKLDLTIEDQTYSVLDKNLIQVSESQ